MSERAALQSPPEARLEARLDVWAASEPSRVAVAAAVGALATAAINIREIVAQGALAGAMGLATGRRSGCDDQKTLDVVANDAIADALRRAPVAALASEEMLVPLPLTAGAPLVVAVDPIDGSSNIDANLSIGTIFAVWPAVTGTDADFLQPGTAQVAAGFVVYGPYTTLVLTVGAGTDIYTLDPASRCFLLTAAGVQIPAVAGEYAINTSNYRHWDEAIRTYIDDCVRGQEGPRKRDYNMRWTAAPIAEFYRILSRGGIFLYPGDQRRGYRNGRLRLVYEANPLAFVMEQAGGAASTGLERILELRPEELHQHVPVICGSRDDVERVVRLHRDPHGLGEQSPLFRRRGLFRI